MGAGGGHRTGAEEEGVMLSWIWGRHCSLWQSRASSLVDFYVISNLSNKI